MSKYALLKNYLLTSGKPYVTLTFERVEEIIGDSLPHSAYVHRAWWSNNEAHTSARNGWLAAGYRVRHVDLERRTVTFVKEGAGTNTSRAGLPRPPSSNNSISVALSNAAEFEKLARQVMSRYFNTDLRERWKPGWPKKFDLVSPDYRIVGDAKHYSMVRGKHLPPAKFATISEHVWFLEKIDADIKFLVFGNDKRVPLEWLRRYGHLVNGVGFYYISGRGQLERLL